MQCKNNNYLHLIITVSFCLFASIDQISLFCFSSGCWLLLRHNAVLIQCVNLTQVCFSWQGCNDYSAQLSLPHVLHIWDALGPNKVRSYQRKLLTSALELLNKEFGHFESTVCPPQMHSPMGLVKLPERLQKRKASDIQVRFCFYHYWQIVLNGDLG